MRLGFNPTFNNAPAEPCRQTCVYGGTSRFGHYHAVHDTRPRMRILGIDPGLQTTGFGVVDVAGASLSYVASGTISTKDVDRGNLPARLKVIFDGVAEVKRRYEPTAASVEIVFVNVNPQSTLLLGQARGAALAALVSGDLPIAEYTALQMKKAIVGHGLADKAQVQDMVMRLLKLPGLPGKPSCMPTPPATSNCWAKPPPCSGAAKASTRAGAATEALRRSAPCTTPALNAAPTLRPHQGTTPPHPIAGARP